MEDFTLSKVETTKEDDKGIVKASKDLVAGGAPLDWWYYRYFMYTWGSGKVVCSLCGRDDDFVELEGAKNNKKDARYDNMKAVAAKFCKLLSKSGEPGLAEAKRCSVEIAEEVSVTSAVF